jgi:nucleoside-diphosphate-sugar epimerase
MTALITGSTGFVGKNLIQYLQDSDISYLVLSRGELKSSAFTKITQSDSIIHLAGKAHAMEKVSDPESYYEINFELTKKLFDAFIKYDAKIFIYISSVKAIADNVDKVLRESDLPNPLTHYGKSKLMAEEYILSKELPEGKSFYILRPCMIHGPDNKGNLNLLYNLVSKGFPWPLGDFENKRSFCSIENLCFIIQELIERDDIPSGVYNIADDVPLSTNEIVRLIAELNGKVARILRLNKSIISSLARLGDLMKLPLNTERLQKLTESYLVSNDKIKSALGKPMPISSKEGLMRTFQSFSNK